MGKIDTRDTLVSLIMQDASLSRETQAQVQEVLETLSDVQQAGVLRLLASMLQDLHGPGILELAEKFDSRKQR